MIDLSPPDTGHQSEVAVPEPAPPARTAARAVTAFSALGRVYLPGKYSQIATMPGYFAL
jgi:hypothetical protein